MRFSILGLVTTLIFSGHVYSTPVVSAVSTPDGVFAALEGDIMALNTSITKDITAIDTLLNHTITDVEAIVKAVVTDAGDIVVELITAGEEILNSTAGLITTLTAPEIKALISILQTVEELVSEIGQDVKSIITGLVSATGKVLVLEVEAIIAALEPFVDPLLAYAASVTGVLGAGVATLLVDLENTVSSLNGTVNGLLSSVLGI